MFLITQTNVSLWTHLSMFIQSPSIFSTIKKRSVELQALKTGIFWSTRIKLDQWPLMFTSLWVSSYILQGKEGKEDIKKTHCAGEIDQYFDSSVTLAPAKLCLLYNLLIHIWQSVWSGLNIYSNSQWIYKLYRVTLKPMLVS